MPSRPKTPCKHPGCAALVPYGTKYCETHKPMHPEEVRSASSRGYGSAWQKARKAFRYVKATDVDHIVPHRGDQKLFWDRSNWQALCHRHHSMKTRREDQTPVYFY